MSKLEEIKKTYIVCEYYDYCKDDYPIKAFFDKDKAKLFKKEKEEELKILQKRYHEKCCNCAYGDKYCELYEKPIIEDSDYDCENRVESYDVFDIYYTIKEIEVE